MVDRREDNGVAMVAEFFEFRVLVAVAGSPQQYRYQRATWTQELLVMVEQTGILISTSTKGMARVVWRSILQTQTAHLATL
ncbi:MAG: hypothetical protein WCJ09_12445 [Planctomycetota bacterium]